jgi:hypothetical protein
LGHAVGSWGTQQIKEEQRQSLYAFGTDYTYLDDEDDSIIDGYFLP